MKIPHFPKNPKIAKIAIFAKIGDLGDILENPIFGHFGGSAKIPHFGGYPGKPQNYPFLPLPPKTTILAIAGATYLERTVGEGVSIKPHRSLSIFFVLLYFDYLFWIIL